MLLYSLYCLSQDNAHMVIAWALACLCYYVLCIVSHRPMLLCPLYCLCQDNAPLGIVLPFSCICSYGHCICLSHAYATMFIVMPLTCKDYNVHYIAYHMSMLLLIFSAFHIPMLLRLLYCLSHTNATTLIVLSFPYQCYCVH